MVSFIDCHLSLRRCSPFNGGKFEGWGTSFCWWPNRIGYLDELSEQAAKLFFDPKEGLGLNIIRYNIGGGEIQLIIILQEQIRWCLGMQ